MQRYNGTTTERLTFNHTDASGTAARQTNASGALIGNTTWGRAAEHSPLGRNIGDAGPYITLNTTVGVENGGSGVLLFPSAQGYRPGRSRFMIDNLEVPESVFMEMIVNSGEIGGIFGLLEMSLRVRDYSVRFNDGNMQLERSFGSEADARAFASRMNQTTVFRNILVNDSWSALLAIQTRNQDYVDPRKVLDEFLKKNPNCLKKINEAGKKQGLKDYNSVLSETPILASTFDETGTLIGRSPLFGIFAENPEFSNMSFYQYQMYRNNKTGRSLLGATTYGRDFPIIWITSTGMGATIKDYSTTPGAVIFHESAHRYFYEDNKKGSHLDIVNSLGIDLLDWDYKSAEGTPEREKEEDFRASESLDAWINRGCKNKPN